MKKTSRAQKAYNLRLARKSKQKRIPLNIRRIPEEIKLEKRKFWDASQFMREGAKARKLRSKYKYYYNRKCK